MTAAAIFDLDRTLLAGSSAPIFQRHLAEADLGSGLSIPGIGAYYRIYEQFGENPLAMRAARLAVRASAGWSVADVTAAATAAAEEIAEQILPYARIEIEEHRDAGRLLVLATTSPEAFVRPLVEALGFYDVVATRWEVEDGAYTGRLAGRFAWGRDKFAELADWADANDVELSQSYAYSDSVYDVPMLRHVAHPVAVNPDLQLEAVARLNNWPVRHFDVPQGVIKVAGRELQDWLRPLNRPELAPNARFDIAGVENIPAEGPCIVVFNHRSYFDSAAVNFTLAKANRPARFLGKKEVFDAPVIGAINTAMGGIRVDRGTGSDEPLERAIEAIKAGEMVTIAPQGTIPRGPAFFEPELVGRWGAAKLAHATKAPVIPLGLWGTELVWPRNQRLPTLNPTDPPEITVRVGPPVDLKYRSVDADTKRIMQALMDLLPPESRVRHEPTEEELARTYPPGYDGDPDLEVDRRPGTDT